MLREDPLFLAVAAACLFVVVILAIGISHFGKGTKEAAIKSNRMMKARIIAQAVAVVLILVFVLVRRG
ncbi:twin transmembrane helix small protein [Mesobacterium pallidum]|uniref:twin transmembrane helix small protein n=1 Tax=Mesobacterium pallidum TaxID=2872037 RepID=UPI00300C71F6